MACSICAQLARARLPIQMLRNWRNDVRCSLHAATLPYHVRLYENSEGFSMSVHARRYEVYAHPFKTHEYQAHTIPLPRLDPGALNDFIQNDAIEPGENSFYLHHGVCWLMKTRNKREYISRVEAMREALGIGGRTEG